MRKKTDVPNATNSNTAVVSNKIISKPSRSKQTAVSSVKKNSTQSHGERETEKGTTFDLVDTAVTGTRDDTSANSSRDRSPTPLESDLLRYLTAHITPMHKQEHSEFYVDVTSFVIGREEYLQGIVRLVQSDCPEVSGDLTCFVQAMQQAFCVVRECANST